LQTTNERTIHVKRPRLFREGRSVDGEKVGDRPALAFA